MRKFILSMAICLFALNIFAQTADSEQLKRDGDKALQTKDYATAFSKYNEYLKLTNYQDSVTAFNCGVCADNTKNYADAAKLFGVAIDKKYNVASAYLGKANALKDLKKNTEYIATVKDGLEALPNDQTLEKLYAIYYLKEGQKFQKANNIIKAEENFKNAASVSSKKWKTDALYSLGALLYNAKDYKKAVEYLQEATTVSPERAEIKKLLDGAQAMIKQ